MAEVECPLHQHRGGADDGDLVVGEIQPSNGRKKRARVVEVIGKRDDPKAISIISMHEQGLKEKFPARVLKDAENLKVPDLKGREDMRQIPLVTIDGADARDFDDAVFAEKTETGFHLIVAIADVFDALTSSRPYKKAWAFEDAVNLILSESGQHFEPKLVKVFTESLTEFKYIMKTYSDETLEKKAS